MDNIKLLDTIIKRLTTTYVAKFVHATVECYGGETDCAMGSSNCDLKQNESPREKTATTTVIDQNSNKNNCNYNGSNRLLDYN
eukprot:6215815-Amphidinium_carterae.1